MSQPSNLALLLLEQDLKKKLAATEAEKSAHPGAPPSSPTLAPVTSEDVRALSLLGLLKERNATRALPVDNLRVLADNSIIPGCSK